MLNCHRLNSWICHRRIISNTFAMNCFHRSRTKVMGSKTMRHWRSRCGSNFSGVVTCFVGLCHLHFLAVACAKRDLLVTMHLMLCALRLTTIPKCQAPWTDSNEGAEGVGSCAYACKAQASARVDVPTVLDIEVHTPLSTLTTAAVCARLNMSATMLST